MLPDKLIPLYIVVKPISMSVPHKNYPRKKQLPSSISKYVAARLYSASPYMNRIIREDIITI